MAVRQRRGGVEVDGLAESINALGRLDGKFKKEAVGIFRYEAKKVQGRSQKMIGRYGRYPKTKGMIGRSATSTGAGVKLRASKYPWALGAEYGERVAHIPINRNGSPDFSLRNQSVFKARTQAQFRPPTSSDMFKNKGGYMIQPTIRAALPGIQENVEQQLSMLIQNAMRQAGVTTHG